MSEAYAKPLPHPDRDGRPFWEGLREGELRVQRCVGCAAHRWPPREVCHRCRSLESEWVALSGRGRVTSWVRTHQLFMPAFRDDVPYDVVQVALEEDSGLRLMGRLTPGGVPSGGLRVRARFVTITDEVTLLHWEPTQD